MADIEKAEVQAAEKSEKKPAPEKKKKVSFGQKASKFFRDYKSELKKVVWATPKQVLNNSILVAVTVIVVGACISVLDFAFSTGLNALGKLL